MNPRNNYGTMDLALLIFLVLQLVPTMQVRWNV